MPKPIRLASPTADAIDGLMSDAPAPAPRKVRRAPEPTRPAATRRRKPAKAAKPAKKVGSRRQVAEGYHRTTLDLPADLHERLRRAAFETNSSIKSILVEAAGPWLKKAGY